MTAAASTKGRAGQKPNDYTSNWKYYLVRFSNKQFEKFRNIVRNRTDVGTISEAIESVMLESDSQNGKAAAAVK